MTACSPKPSSNAEQRVAAGCGQQDCNHAHPTHVCTPSAQVGACPLLPSQRSLLTFTSAAQDARIPPQHGRLATTRLRRPAGHSSHASGGRSPMAPQLPQAQRLPLLEPLPHPLPHPPLQAQHPRRPAAPAPARRCHRARRGARLSAINEGWQGTGWAEAFISSVRERTQGNEPSPLHTFHAADARTHATMPPTTLT